MVTTTGSHRALGDTIRACLQRLGPAASDAELLGRFNAIRDEAAFAELVRRYAGVVLGVCRRFLGDTPEADEAFQATFVVLAHKAARLRQAGQLGGWLHGVATLVAKKARSTRHRRHQRQMTGACLEDVAAGGVLAEPDFAPLLDEELTRLPEKFRLPIVLCGLRALSTAEAAQLLGWPVGTLASRLSRGRTMLHERLVQRGVLGATALALLAGLPHAAAVAPSALLHTTTALALGSITAPTAVLVLVSHMVFHMKMQSLRLLAAGVLGLGSLALLGPGQPLAPPQANAASLPAAAKAKPAIDRVKVNNFQRLLDQDDVRKEVGMTKEEFALATEALQKQIEEITKNDFSQVVRIRATFDLPAGVAAGNAEISFDELVDSEQTMRKKQAAVDQNQKTLEAKLTPEGFVRLKQLSLQSLGAELFLHRVVLRELQLTPEQEDAFDAYIRPTVKIAASTPSKKDAEDFEKDYADAVKLLTAEQKKRLDALLGKSFTTASLLKASPRFGGSTKNFLVGPDVDAVRDVNIMPAAPPIPPPAPKKP